MDQHSYDFLLKIDVALDTTIIDAVNESQVRVHPRSQALFLSLLEGGEAPPSSAENKTKLKNCLL
jgi:hypothetical protein